MSIKKRSATVELQKINEQLQKEIIERKKAEEEIKHSVSLLDATLESTADGILVVDRKGKIEKFNRKFVQMWRIPESILASKDVDRALAFTLDQLKEPEGFLKKVRGLYNLPEAESYDVLEFKDGRVFERYLQPQRIGDQIIGRVSSFRDVTERKQMEQALIRNETIAKRLSQENEILAEIGRIISSTLNIEEIYERFAEEVRKLIPFDRIVINTFNIERGTLTNVYMAGGGIEDRKVGEVYPLQGSGNAEMVRTNSTLLVQTEDFNEYKDRFPMLLTTFQAGFRSIMNVPLFSKGQIIGGLLLRSLKPYAYTDKEVKLAEKIGDQIAGAIANAKLFIERKQAEEALRQSEEKYRTILENIEDGYLEVDLAGNFTFVNDAECRNLGYTKEELIGMSNRQYTDETTARKLYQIFNVVYRTGEPVKVLDVEVIRKDGIKVVNAISISLIRDSEGKPIGFRGIARDITERKRTEEEKEKLILQLQKALAEVKQLGGLLPICASCKKIRDDKGYWSQIEIYIRDHSEAEFTHGICPDCFKKLYPDIEI